MHDMALSMKTSGRIVGALILLAFVFYGGGSGLLDAGAGTPVVLVDAAENQTMMSAGGLLILINSLGVAMIGVVAFPILRRTHPISAFTYLVTRVFEAVMLAVSAVLMLLVVPISREFVASGSASDSVLPSLARAAQEGSLYAYWFAMTGLALGSLLFCRALFQARLVPRFLAVWGIVGYVILATGGMLEVLGYGIGLALSIPGGLFEVAVGSYLVVKGFSAADDRLGRRMDAGASSDILAPVSTTP